MVSSLAYQVIAEQQRAKSMEEEMRVLYVAMTRAKNRLILSCSEKIKKCAAVVLRGAMNDKRIEDWQLASCRTFLEWVLYGVSDQRTVHDAFETGMKSEANDEGLFDLKVYDAAEQARLNEYADELIGNKKSGAVKSKSKAKSKDMLKKVKAGLAWRYQFDDVSLMAAKRSVSELTHTADEYVRFDYSDFLDRSPKAILPPPAKGKVDGKLLGTATHLVISRLDLSKPITEKSIEVTKEKLLAQGAIDENIADCIDTDSIIAFFESRLGRKVLDCDNVVLREWPFSFAIPATDSKGRSVDDETVIVQGIIDMLVKTKEGLVIIDFKTDRVITAEIAERAQLYRRQLELYGKAAETILDENVSAKWLYFFRPGEAVKID